MAQCAMADDPAPPRKPRGRPPLAPGAPSATLNVRMPARQYDETYAKARAARVSMGDWVRAALRRANRAKP
jgi:predicted HicB family RNase H-like nuclease